MSRLSSRIRWLLVVMAVAVVVPVALAQVPRNPAPGRTAPTAAQTTRYLMIPGLMPLGMEGVPREIGISSEQKQQLKALSDGYQAAVQRVVEPLREMSPEEQQKQAAAVRDKIAQLARSTQRKAEAILTPQQLRAVERITFELSVGQALGNPAAQEKLGLDESQRIKLMSIYEQANEKMQKLQRDTAGEIMQVLTPEQSAKLKQQMEAAQKPQP